MNNILCQMVKSAVSFDYISVVLLTAIYRNNSVTNISRQPTLKVCSLPQHKMSAMASESECQNTKTKSKAQNLVTVQSRV